MTPLERATQIRDQLPAGGLFAGLTWRIAPEAFPLPADLVTKLEALGPQLLAFYRACNTLYRHSLAGKEPKWVADYLDAGKPQRLLEISRQDRIKSHIPRNNVTVEQTCGFQPCQCNQQLTSNFGHNLPRQSPATNQQFFH